MKFTALAAALLSGMALSGCVSLVDAQSKCSAQSASYLTMWDCIRGRVAAGTAGMMNNDLGVRYLAVGDLLAQSVRSGQMSDAEAKARLAIELERDNAEFNRRQAASSPSLTRCTNNNGVVNCLSF